MKIQRLELRAYGPFTDQKLDLAEPGHGLYVIYGANEAGKSSALRALTAGLFGIHARTKDNFRHGYTALRLGMSIESAQGEQLSFVRRKSTKSPLMDAADAEPLAEGVLRPFLGDVDADEFERVFGLDHERLRQGSENLLDVAEGADAAIVGAALGVNHLREVRDALDKAAGEVFAERGKKAPVNAALIALKDLSKGLRQSGTSQGEWSRAQSGAAAALKARDLAVTRKVELDHRAREFEFVSRNRPRIERLVKLRGELAALAAVPDLDPGFAERRREAEAKRLSAEVLRDQSIDEAKLRRDALAGLPDDFSLLEHQGEIDELRRLASVSKKGSDDREHLAAKAELGDQECARMAAEIGLEAPLAAAVFADLRLALGAQERVGRLLAEHVEIRTSQRDAAARLQGLGAKQADCQQRLAESAGDQASGEGHRSLDLAVTAALKHGDLDGELSARRRELKDVDDAITQGLTGLSGYRGEASELASCPVPGPEALEEFRRRFDEFDDEARQLRHQAAELREDHSKADAELERYAAQQAVPSEEDLGAVRARRDAQWQLIRAAWLEAEDVQQAASALDAERPLVESFGRSVETSDQLADRMRRESDRVAALAELRRKRDQIDADLSACQLAEAQREQRLQPLDAEWSAAWQDSGLELGTPARMKDILDRRAGLLLSLGRRSELLGQIEQLTERIRQTRSALQAASGVAMDRECLEPLLQAAIARRDELAELRQVHRSREEEAGRLLAEQREEQLNCEQLQARLGEWQDGFTAVVRGLPVQAGDPPDAVPGRLRQVDALLKCHDEAAGFHQRIAGIAEDGRKLGAHLAEFCARHLPELSGQEPEAVVGQLVDLVELRKRQQQTFEEADQRARDSAGQQQQASAAFEVATGTLEILAREAGVASVDLLPEIERRAEAKRRLGEARQTVEGDLVREGCSIEVTEARVAQLDGVEIESKLEVVQAELATLAAEVEAKRNAASASQHALDTVVEKAGRAEAAAVAAQLAETEAGLVDGVERYVHLVVASRLLGTAVERFRERHEAPMLRYASKHLSGLTHGRYTRVETDLDERGRPHFLVREGSAGEAKMVEALSDGTRDQLQLALVLGSLQHRLDAAVEPMPLVLDDILVHFDDGRSLAALEVLAEFAKRGQVLLFTHHQRVVEQARSLGSAHGVAIREI